MSIFRVILSILILLAPRLALTDGSIAPASEIRIEQRSNANGTRSLWAIKNNAEYKITDITVLPKGTQSYHWLGESHYNQVVKLGAVVPAEMNKILDEALPTGTMQGNGFYASLNPIDSASYGPKALILTAPRDLALIDSDSLLRASQAGFDLYPGSEAKLAHLLKDAGIDGRFSGTYISFLHPDAVSQIRGADNESLYKALGKLPNNDQGLTGLAGTLTLSDHGFGKAPPNSWTKKYAPAWDKMLRGENLSASDKKKILAAVEYYFSKSQNGQSNISGSFFNLPNDDPRLINVYNFFAQESQAHSTPKISEKIAAYNKYLADLSNARIQWTTESGVPFPSYVEPSLDEDTKVFLYYDKIRKSFEEQGKVSSLNRSISMAMPAKIDCENKFGAIK